MAGSVQNINPAVLQWARERKNFSLTEIVGKLSLKSVTEEVIDGWEKGSGSPTYPQLERLADYYHIPIAVFFFPELPNVQDAALSLRSSPDFDFDLISHNTLDVIHRVQATQMALKELNDGINPVASPIHKLFQLHDSTDVDFSILAKELRGEKFLDIPFDEQLKWDNFMQALDAWRDAIEARGIFVFRWPFKSEELSGFCLYDEEFPVICLNSQEGKGRQIFTLLHELVHLLHGQSSVTSSKDGFEIKRDTVQQSEHYFDGFAGSVLVPLDDLKKQIEKADLGEKYFYTDMAKRYKVSPKMVLVTCLLNSFIYYDSFKNIKEKLSDYVSKAGSDGGGNYYRTHVSYWGKAFLYNILRKRHQNRISEYEVSQILNMKIQNIEKLEGYLIQKQIGM